MHFVGNFFNMTDFEVSVLIGQLSHILEISLKFNKPHPKQ